VFPFFYFPNNFFLGGGGGLIKKPTNCHKKSIINLKLKKEKEIKKNSSVKENWIVNKQM